MQYFVLLTCFLYSVLNCVTSFVSSSRPHGAKGWFGISWSYLLGLEPMKPTVIYFSCILNPLLDNKNMILWLYIEQLILLTLLLVIELQFV